MFRKYDFDNSGSLDKGELVHVFNDVLGRFKIPITLDASEAEALLYEIDENSDGSISPEELFVCLRNLILNEMGSNYHG